MDFYSTNCASLSQLWLRFVNLDSLQDSGEYDGGVRVDEEDADGWKRDVDILRSWKSCSIPVIGSSRDKSRLSVEGTEAPDRDGTLALVEDFTWTKKKIKKDFIRGSKLARPLPISKALSLTASCQLVRSSMHTEWLRGRAGFLGHPEFIYQTRSRYWL